MPVGPLVVVLLGIFGSGAAWSASWNITPLLDVTETYSDNIALASDSLQQGWISDISPGIRIDGASAKLTAYLDYRRQNLYYQGNSQWNRQQNQLSSFAKLEAVDNWLFVDASSNISQQRLSVFSPASSDGTSATADRVETRSVVVSPYVRGQLSNIADYTVRYSTADLRSDSASLADTRVKQYSASVKSRSLGVIGWFGDAVGSKVNNDLIGDRDDARFRVGLLAPVGAHLHLSVFSGKERTNYASPEQETTSMPGVGIEWSPSKQTQFVGLREKRFFGYGHSMQFSHRTALTAWRYFDGKDVAMLPALLGGYSSGTIQELMSDLLESSIPDPIQRSRAVRARLDQSGSAASLSGTDGVLTSRLYIDRVREASVALLGIRNTVTLLLRQRDEKLLANAPVAVDSFSDTSDIRERSASLTWLYRLTPLTTLNVSLEHRKSESMSVAELAQSQDTQTLALSFRLAPKASASLGVRRLRADGLTSQVRENALVGSFMQEF